jgi:hypothetical protein
MKKLYLASFVFETGEIEYKDHQLVLVTDKDVKAVNDQVAESNCCDHRYAAYNLAEGWFKQTYPESKLTHLICNYPIQSAGIGGKEHNEYGTIESESAVKAPFYSNEFSGPHSCKDEFPALVPDLEDLSETVCIDLKGRMKDWDFGWYDFTKKEWCMQNRDFERSFEIEYAKWFSPPKPR